MKNVMRRWHISVVDVVVGLAVLMILSGLVVPIFIPPQGKAASRTAAARVSTNAAQR